MRHYLQGVRMTESCLIDQALHQAWWVTAGSSFWKLSVLICGQLKQYLKIKTN